MNFFYTGKKYQDMDCDQIHAHERKGGVGSQGALLVMVELLTRHLHKWMNWLKTMQKVEKG